MRLNGQRRRNGLDDARVIQAFNDESHSTIGFNFGKHQEQGNTGERKSKSLGSNNQTHALAKMQVDTMLEGLQCSDLKHDIKCGGKFLKVNDTTEVPTIIWTQGRERVNEPQNAKESSGSTQRTDLCRRQQCIDRQFESPQSQSQKKCRRDQLVLVWLACDVTNVGIVPRDHSRITS